MAEKKSEMVRISVELDERLNRLQSQLAKNGQVLTKTETSRIFAENAILPQEDVKDAFKRLGKYRF